MVFNWGCFLALLGGAVICQLFSLNSDKVQGIKPFLQRFFPDMKEKWCFRINSILFPLIGAILAYILIAPDDLKSSLLTGITWCGSLHSFGIFIEKN